MNSIYILSDTNEQGWRYLYRLLLEKRKHNLSGWKLLEYVGEKWTTPAESGRPLKLVNHRKINRNFVRKVDRKKLEVRVEEEY